MRLKRVAVKGLFGLFDHEIPFVDNENVAIIHGPNGFGKTVMLRMIGALVSGQSTIFQQIPFSEFWLDFDDGSRRGAVRVPTDGSDQTKLTLTFQHILPDGTVKGLVPPPPVPKDVLDYIDSFVPGLPRYRDGWRDGRGRFLSLTDILSRYPMVRDHLPAEYRSRVNNLAMEGFRVFFVETNRLLASQEIALGERYVTRASEYEREHDESRLLRVVQYSTDIIRRMQVVLANYAKHSQESDRTFPERLVNFLRTHHPALTEREILGEMGDLEESRQRLINLGFLDTEKGLSDLTEDDVKRAREALTIYVGDVREKLKVFDEMALRVGMLTDILNERFKYKKLNINREHGLHLLSGAGVTVDLSNLSSGEQHQLVLLYELLFMVPKNGLVLVDEPEISLHVAWQSRFLTDLLGILKITGAHAVIATHAPAIIGNRWDLAVQLQGPRAEGPANAS